MRAGDTVAPFFGIVEIRVLERFESARLKGEREKIEKWAKSP